jgi:hypothetical protein
MGKKRTAEFAGHGRSTDGSWDPGCVNGKVTEADLVEAIGKSFVSYSKGSGVDVVTDLPANNINMIKQVILSNNKGCKVHVALHCDYKLAPTGTAPLYKSAEGRKLAYYLNQAVMKDMSMKTRGLTHRSDLYELNSTDAVAVIFECGSIGKDIRKMKDAKRYGRALAKGLCRYYGVKFTGKRK